MIEIYEKKTSKKLPIDYLRQVRVRQWFAPCLCYSFKSSLSFEEKFVLIFTPIFIYCLKVAKVGRGIRSDYITVAHGFISIKTIYRRTDFPKRSCVANNQNAFEQTITQCSICNLPLSRSFMSHLFRFILFFLM